MSVVLTAQSEQIPLRQGVEYSCGSACGRRYEPSCAVPSPQDLDDIEDENEQLKQENKTLLKVVSQLTR